MPHTLKILMAQINPTVGAIEANCLKICDIIEANQESHDLILFPELAVTGYPPEDLLLRHEFYLRASKALDTIRDCTQKCHVVVGHPSHINGLHYNSASIIHHGKISALYHKQKLPNYGVFDEKRYFTPGTEPCLFTLNGYRLGLCICEDLWVDGPVEQILEAHADILLCLNASPFEVGKYKLRDALLKNHTKRGLTAIYVNQIGGQDELLFDGQSMAINSQGHICARAPSFDENLSTVIIKGTEVTGEITPLLSHEALIYQALSYGLKDYVNKNGFPGVLIGLSGGIDSALTLAIAVDALGASRVHAVMMPSRYSADMSLEDAKKQADTMNVKHSTLPIELLFSTFLATLAPSFEGYSPDTTEENLQARIRGVLLMALSNKTGNMVITTSNKSETAVGYATLYGDMAGGFCVLKDLLKTDVYRLARFRNQRSPVIPERVLTRAPSAELAANQTDQDSLPEYDILDAIIKLYMESSLSAPEIISQGFDEKIVLNVLRLIKLNEYKRFQAAPGIKISTTAFGRDWRYPLTSGFHQKI